MASAVTGFLFTLVLIQVLIPVARGIGLVASPGQHRQHDGLVPLVGGIAMVLGAGFSSLIFSLSIGQGIVGAVGLLLVVGVVDDRYVLPYIVRFLVQIGAVWLMIYLDDIRLIDLGRVFSTDVASLGDYSTALTIFAAAGVINAVNMVDGMDGLAGSLVLVCLLSGFFQLMLAGSADLPLIGLLISVVAGFLVFNLPGIKGSTARIFMGDAGSMVLGIWLAWLLIRYSQGENRAFAPVIGLWMLIVPLFDAVGVLLRRLVRFGSPFHADRMHTHHLLLRLGFSVYQSLAVLISVSVIMSLSAFGLYYAGVSEHHLFYLFVALFVGYILCMELGEFRLRQRN